VPLSLDFDGLCDFYRGDAFCTKLRKLLSDDFFAWKFLFCLNPMSLRQSAQETINKKIVLICLAYLPRGVKQASQAASMLSTESLQIFNCSKHSPSMREMCVP